MITVIDASYQFQPTKFRNGNTVNEAGQNSGSCKVFSFAKLNGLSKEETLACFGAFYRNDVLQNPEGTDHQNIRNFIEFGWDGIEFEGQALQSTDAAVQAKILIVGKDFQPHPIYPVFAIKDGMVAMPPVENEEVGVRARFANIDPQTGKFTFAINTTQRDFIVLKAIEKPLINVLWIGTLVLTLGFVLAIIRRYREFKLMRDKGL